MVVAHAGGDPVTQVFEHDRRNPRHVKPACLGNREPDKFDKLRVRPDKAFGLVGDRADLGRKETAIEAPRAQNLTRLGPGLKPAGVTRLMCLDSPVGFDRTNLY